MNKINEDSGVFIVFGEKKTKTSGKKIFRNITTKKPQQYTQYKFSYTQSD